MISSHRSTQKWRSGKKCLVFGFLHDGDFFKSCFSWSSLVWQGRVCRLSVAPDPRSKAWREDSARSSLFCFGSMCLHIGLWKQTNYKITLLLTNIHPAVQTNHWAEYSGTYLRLWSLTLSVPGKKIWKQKHLEKFPFLACLESLWTNQKAFQVMWISLQSGKLFWLSSIFEGWLGMCDTLFC